MSREDRAARARAQEERAKQSLDAIFLLGANPADEALVLANEFADAQTGRSRAWLRRAFRRNVGLPEHPGSEPAATPHRGQHGGMGTNASGNESGGSAETYDVVDSGQSDDIESSLTAQGTSDRETLDDIDAAQGDVAHRDAHGNRIDPADPRE